MKRFFLSTVMMIGVVLAIQAVDAVAQVQPSLPSAQRGVLDVAAWQKEHRDPIDLQGQWAFYWNRLLSPEDFQPDSFPTSTGWFSMPGVWNGTVVDHRELGGRGYATFRLRLKIDPSQGRQALLVPYAFAAYRLWIDDRRAVTVGRVGTGPENMTPRYQTRVVFFDPPPSGEIDLTLQISNFMHAKGGMRAPIRLVPAALAPGFKHRALSMDVLVFGCLTIMSIYHLALYVFRPIDRFNLYFAACCLLFAVRAALTGEVFLADLLPAIDWHIFVRLEWLCVYVGGPLAVAFVRSLFPEACPRWMSGGSLVIGAILAVVTLMAPTTVFTGMFAYLTPLIGLFLGVTAWVLVKAVLTRRPFARLMLVSLLLVIAAVVNDMLYANDLIQTGYLIPYGMLLFVFSQAMILANRSSRAFQRLEKTNIAHEREISERKQAEAKVKAYQEHLEELVQERTDALEQTNQRLQRELDEREAAEMEKLNLLARLQRARRMEALGTLAGGVAHDLNNILSGLVGYPDLLLQDLPADSHLRRPMLTIQQSGQKAAAIVQDLLTLARRGVADFDVVDLNQVVDDYLQSPEYEKMIQFHPAVVVDVDLAADLKGIKGSPVHLLKTVMNLVSNAAEAMPEGGVIRVRTENRYLDGPVGGYETVQEGEYVILVVSDCGIGMTSSDLERIFEPFYSKKVMGKSGTGLGMAVVWGTVKDHRGYIDARSREGAGTTFSLYFPATLEAISEVCEQPSLADLQGSGQSILIVDDVAEQRDMATAMLSKLGYRVQAVASGEAAVDHVLDQPADLLLLDMIMDPGIDGLETYRRINAIHSGQRAVIASGYAETERVRRLQQLGPIPYLKKPYRLETLAEIVKATLQAA